MNNSCHSNRAHTILEIDASDLEIAEVNPSEEPMLAAEAFSSACIACWICPIVPNDASLAGVSHSGNEEQQPKRTPGPYVLQVAQNTYSPLCTKPEVLLDMSEMIFSCGVVDVANSLLGRRSCLISEWSDADECLVCLFPIWLSLVILSAGVVVCMSLISCLLIFFLAVCAGIVAIGECVVAAVINSCRLIQGNTVYHGMIRKAKDDRRTFEAYRLTEPNNSILELELHDKTPIARGLRRVSLKIREVNQPIGHSDNRQHLDASIAKSLKDGIDYNRPPQSHAIGGCWLDSELYSRGSLSHGKVEVLIFNPSTQCTRVARSVDINPEYMLTREVSRLQAMTKAAMLMINPIVTPTPGEVLLLCVPTLVLANGILIQGSGSRAGIYNDKTQGLQMDAAFGVYAVSNASLSLQDCCEVLDNAGKNETLLMIKGKRYTQNTLMSAISIKLNKTKYRATILKHIDQHQKRASRDLIARKARANSPFLIGKDVSTSSTEDMQSINVMGASCEFAFHGRVADWYNWLPTRRARRGDVKRQLKTVMACFSVILPLVGCYDDALALGTSDYTPAGEFVAAMACTLFLNAVPPLQYTLSNSSDYQVDPYEDTCGKMIALVNEKQSTETPLHMPMARSSGTLKGSDRDSMTRTTKIVQNSSRTTSGQCERCTMQDRTELQHTYIWDTVQQHQKHIYAIQGIGGTTRHVYIQPYAGKFHPKGDIGGTPVDGFFIVARYSQRMTFSKAQKASRLSVKPIYAHVDASQLTLAEIEAVRALTGVDEKERVALGLKRLKLEAELGMLQGAPMQYDMPAAGDGYEPPYEYPEEHFADYSFNMGME